MCVYESALLWFRIIQCEKSLAIPRSRMDTWKRASMLGILFKVDTVYTMMYRPPNESIVVILQYYLTNHNLRLWLGFTAWKRMREHLD